MEKTAGNKTFRPNRISDPVELHSQLQTILEKLEGIRIDKHMRITPELFESIAQTTKAIQNSAARVFFIAKKKEKKGAGNVTFSNSS